MQRRIKTQYQTLGPQNTISGVWAVCTSYHFLDHGTTMIGQLQCCDCLA